MNHIKSFFFLFLYCLPLLWRNLYFNPNCLPVVMIKAWLDDLHYKCHRAFGLALMNHRLCVQSPLTCVLFLPWLMNTPPEKKASRSSSGHRFTFPIRAASKRGKAGTLRVLFFPWDEGISLELLSYLPVSWMQHKSLVVEEVLAQAALPWLWSWFRVFSQAGISCSNSGATSMLGEQIQLTRDELMSF